MVILVTPERKFWTGSAPDHERRFVSDVKGPRAQE